MCKRGEANERAQQRGPVTRRRARLARPPSTASRRLTRPTPKAKKNYSILTFEPWKPIDIFAFLRRENLSLNLVSEVLGTSELKIMVMYTTLSNFQSNLGTRPNMCGCCGGLGFPTHKVVGMVNLFHCAILAIQYKRHAF